MPDMFAAAEPATASEVVLEKVRALLPAIRERADESEKNRSIPKISAREFLDAGLARILLPKRHGGTELGLRLWVDVCEEIGRADAAHGWCASLMIHHPHYLAQFPEAAQADVWADGPDVSLAGTLTPNARIQMVDGGYRISSEVGYISGVNHSSRVFVGGMLPTASGEPDWTLFLVPGDQFKILDTWNTTGMRGTGSNTLLVEDVFVPYEHTLRVADMRDATTPGSLVNKTPFFNAPWITYAPLTFLAPILGAARGALDDYVQWTKSRISRFGAQVSQYTSIQANIARAESDLDAASLLMRRCIDVAEAPTPASDKLRARSYRDQSRAAELIVAGMDLIMKISGAGGFATNSRIQRAWRDVHFGASHVILNPEVSFVAWGRMRLGIERDNSQFMY